MGGLGGAPRADEEDGTPGVAITSGTDDPGYYEINGTNVELTAAGAAFVQSGGTLPTLNGSLQNTSIPTVPSLRLPNVRKEKLLEGF